MKVIARNNQPPDVRSGECELLEGKEYEVIECAYPNHKIKGGHWIIRTGDFINQREPRFFIKVLNEYGHKADYWNDYFLSHSEMRITKLESIGV